MKYFLLVLILFFSYTVLSQDRGSWFRDGNIKFKNEDYLGAIEAYTKIIDENPGRESEVYFNRAMAHSEVNKFLEALYDYKMFIENANVMTDEQYSDVLLAFENSAIILMRMGDHQGAIELMDEILFDDIDFSTGYFLRGINKLYLDDFTGCNDLKLAAGLGHKKALELSKDCY